MSQEGTWDSHLHPCRSNGEVRLRRKDKSTNTLLDFILVPESLVLLQAELNGVGSLQELKQQKILGVQNQTLEVLKRKKEIQYATK